MDSKLLLAFGMLLAIALPAAVLGQACPIRCLCFRMTVRCMHLELTRIPQVDNRTKTLDLRFNQIQEIPPGAFTSLPNLSTLLLNNNNIRIVRNGAFAGLSELKYLYLYKNKITEIESRAFEGLIALEQLYLYSNDLQELQPGTFSNLPSLERLFLNNNFLGTIEPGTFSGLDALKRLRLDSNKLVCNCKLMWLITMLSEASRARYTQAAASCEYPTGLRGRNLVDVTPEELSCQRPHFVLEPTDVDATEGNNVYFSCRAMGDPEPEIIWLHNEVEIPTITTESASITTSNTSPSSGKYNVLDDGTLMIQNASGEDEGEYECMARNAVGEAITRAVSLRYFGAPKAPIFSLEPQDTQGRQGQSIVLHCSANGYPRPSITWTRSGENVLENSRFVQLPPGSLQITDIRHHDHGEYVCEATNNIGTARRTARLSVLVPPSFDVRPEFVSAIEGSTVELHCRAHGYPAPVIAWRKDDTTLPDDRRYLIMASGTLRIVRVTREDEGNYDCHAVNTAGQRHATAQIEIRPRVPPVFTQSPSDLQIITGATIRLPCSATGDPSPIITWSKDGIQITESGKFSMSAEGHLVIRDVGPDDQGRYECAARNSIGYAATSMQLTVIVPFDDREGDQFVEGAISEAISNVERAINSTQRDLFDTTKPKTPGDLLTLFRFPSSEASSIARAAEVFERTLQLIHDRIEVGMKVNLTGIEFAYNDLVSPRFLNLIANLSGCTAHRKTVNCSDICYHRKYRTQDGSCNNLQHPEWGASSTPFKRLLKPIYENGFNTPVGWNISQTYNGHFKPSARKLSVSVISTETTTPHAEFSHMLMQWGQFLDHDMDFTVTSLSRAQFSDGLECKDTCENQPPCFPINVPEDDPRIRRTRCMEFTRSSAVCGSGVTSGFFNTIMPREQINQITSYIDASNVYGSTKEEANNLRDFADNLGRMKVGLLIDSSGKHLLPFNRDTPIDCQRDTNESPIPCFLAGDFRANEQLGLLSMHTIWIREHNRIAAEILTINPHWDGERIYQETRKIIGAQMQHITYKFWLPKVLGPQIEELIGRYEGYDPNMDASILNAFATAALRFGHSMIQPFINRLNSTFQPIEQGNLPLHKAFFSPYRVVEEGGIDPILRGLINTPLKDVNPEEMMNTELTEHLFEMAHTIALDLAALNIQRGRDHALPGYNDWRSLCNMTSARTFDEVAEEISNGELRDKLEDLYHHPGNMDLFVAGLAEDAIGGGLLGPTFTCILAKQFHRLRAGDRFWYENPGVFTPEQLTQIKQVTLGGVLCDNGDAIDRVQTDVFRKADFPTGYKPCSKIPSMDLRMWAECPEDLVVSSLTVGTHSRSRRATKYAFSQQLTNTTIDKQQENKGKSDKPSKDYRDHDFTEMVAEDRTTKLEEAVSDLQDVVDNMQATIKALTKQVDKLKRDKKKILRKLEETTTKSKNLP